MTKEERIKRISKIHNCLPGRTVILKSITDTKRRGWITPGNDDSRSALLGKKGCIKEVHENVFEAVKVTFENGDERYWSYQDLMLVEVEQKPKIFHFDPAYL